jgi:hypothetical protein
MWRRYLVTNSIFVWLSILEIGKQLFSVQTKRSAFPVEK